MLEGMKWATQAFSLPAEKQKTIFPEDVNIANEIGIEWEFSLEELKRPEVISSLTEEQKLAFKSLDDYLLSIAGSEHPQYWTNEAVFESEEWKKIRILATNILNIMGWKHELEPQENLTILYVDEEE